MAIAEGYVLRKRYQRYGVKALLESDDILPIDLPAEEIAAIRKQGDAEERAFKEKLAALRAQFLKDVAAAAAERLQQELRGFPATARQKLQRLFEEGE